MLRRSDARPALPNFFERPTRPSCRRLSDGSPPPRWCPLECVGWTAHSRTSSKLRLQRSADRANRSRQPAEVGARDLVGGRIRPFLRRAALSHGSGQLTDRCSQLVERAGSRSRRWFREPPASSQFGLKRDGPSQAQRPAATNLAIPRPVATQQRIQRPRRRDTLPSHWS